MKNHLTGLGLAALGLSAAAAQQPNVLVVLADDFGVSDVTVYGEGSDYAKMPTLESLAAQGVSFRNAYSNPVCSPTRAVLQTGRYSFRNGIGSSALAPYALPLSEPTLPEVLDWLSSGYTHATIGKWHLGNLDTGGVCSPNNAGYGHADIRQGNLVQGQSYFKWWNVVDCQSPQWTTGYVTTHTVDQSIAWTQTAAEPWFLSLNFNTPHGPLHAPPGHLHSVDLSGLDPLQDKREYYKAMVEAMDTELGRLVSTLDLTDTVLIFLGDNGTDGPVIPPPWDPAKAKKTVYEGGINVPLIVVAPGLVEPGRFSDALVDASDVMATLADAANVTIPSHASSHLDTVSFYPYLFDSSLPSARTYSFSEQFSPNGPSPNVSDRAIRGDRYKLIRLDDGTTVTELFFDLEQDPFEDVDLLEAGLDPAQQAAYDTLSAQLDALLGS